MRPFDPGALADRRVLLVAPHPDDEALGCGGAAHLLARAGARVRVVVCSSGAGGIDGDASAATRRAESERACQRLGVAAPVFLERSSEALRAAPLETAAGMDAELGTASVDVMLVPSPLERHDTHRAVLLAALLSRVAAEDAAWWGYAVWDAIPADDDVVEVDVTEARAAKTRAIAAHVSQDGARSLGAGMAARDMAQAVFSRITGEESRKAVERLVDLSPLARGGERSVTDCRARLRRWVEQRSRHQARALWPEDAG